MLFWKKEKAETIGIKDVLKTHVRREPDIPEQKLQAQIDRLHEQCGRLLPIERAVRDRLQAEIAERRLRLAMLPLDRKYERIDMRFLQVLRHSRTLEMRVPVFALFDIDRPDCIIGSGGSTEPDKFSDYVTKVVELLRERAAQRQTRPDSFIVPLHLTASFAAAIPDDVRPVIAEARKEFERLFIVTEAPEWRLNESVVAPADDPLLIGRKQNLHWLIKPFDTTTAEEYVRREFTSNPKT